MALVKATLKAALKAIFDGTADTSPVDGDPDGTPTDAADAGARLAKAYTDYAAGGLFGASTVSAGVGAKEAPLASTLAASLAVPGLPATHAAAWGAGLVTFWAAVPVVGAQAGATVPPTGAAACVAALTALFSNTGNSADDAADGLANALDTCTKTTTAAVAPPPGTVLPIS